MSSFVIGKATALVLLFGHCMGLPVSARRPASVIFMRAISIARYILRIRALWLRESRFSASSDRATMGLCRSAIVAGIQARPRVKRRELGGGQWVTPR